MEISDVCEEWILDKQSRLWFVSDAAGFNLVCNLGNEEILHFAKLLKDGGSPTSYFCQL